MAWLIAGDAAAARDVAVQREFFARFLAPWVESLADAIEHSGVTDFYKHAGRLLREFLAIERQAFEFESP
jgi:TorA maturation chaperone TorD